MKYSPEAWQHLADCLKSARNGRSVASIAAAAGISHATIEAYENGRPYRNGPPDKMWQLVNFYRWTPDSLRRVLAGGLPTVLPEVEPTPDLGERLYDDLAARLSAADWSPRDKRRIWTLLSEGRTPAPPEEHQEVSQEL